VGLDVIPYGAFLPEREPVAAVRLADEIAAAGFEGFEFTGSTDKEGALA
jgi:hypothetical protein